MLDKLNIQNDLPVLPVEHPAFSRYGRVVQGYDFSGVQAYMERQTAVPMQGNCYVTSEPGLEALPVAAELERGFYGGMPLQMGYCNGNNSSLNCFEYHKSSELDIAITPQVLLLAHLDELRGNVLESGCAHAFFLPAGTAVELFGTTLHFSPCKVCNEGFKTVIVLPKGTNLPLSFARPENTPEDALLWMTNKWLLTLPGTAQAEKGAFLGIKGKNINIRFQ